MRAAEQVNAESYKVVVAEPATFLPALFAWTKQRSTTAEELQVQPATLEDVFVSLTGRNLRDG